MSPQMRSDSTSTLCTSIVIITGHVPVLFYNLVQRARITCFRCRFVRCLRHFECLAECAIFNYFRHNAVPLAGQNRTGHGRAGLCWVALCLAGQSGATSWDTLSSLYENCTNHMSHITSKHIRIWELFSLSAHTPTLVSKAHEPPLEKLNF